MKSDLDRLKKALKKVGPVLRGLTIEETARILGSTESSIETYLKFILAHSELIPEINPDIDLKSFVVKISEILRNNPVKLKEAFRRIAPILEGMTIEETAQFLNISASSVDKALKYVRDNANELPKLDPSINPEEFVDELGLILRSNTTKGRKNAIHSGGKATTWTDEIAIKIAHLFLANGLTLRRAAAVFGYPKSTILEMFNSEAIVSNSELYYDIRTLLQTNAIIKDEIFHNSVELSFLAHEKEELVIKYKAICKEKGYDGDAR